MTASSPENFHDKLWMTRALRLAALGRETAPNPMVGCVFVNASCEKIGEGWHVRPGEPHAEVNALRSVSQSAHGATAYVTLEPCAHHGRTPPCADALISAGVGRVVIAMTDPDKRVAGMGIARLRAAGISVDIGVCEEAARRLNAAYIKHRETGLPYVTLKTAMTLDGKIATVTGDSRWITSPITRTWAHRQLRARNEAILVGVGTVIADDPTLTTRLAHRPDARNPLRIIVDSGLRTPLSAHIVRLAKSDNKTLIAYTEADETRINAFTEAGVRLMRIKSNQGHVDLGDLLHQLGTQIGVISVLVEGGAQIAGALMRGGFVDRYICTIAPKIVGGSDAPGPLGGLAIANRMADAHEFDEISVRRSGNDITLDCKSARMV